jgi:isocitrate/isopropylmalate dehydrogenase
MPPTAGKILVLPGDHIGPEVVTEALAVLDIIEAHKGIKFEREFDLCGGCSLDKHGIASTEEVLQKSVQADAVFFGSAGGPEWGTKQPNPESGLLRVREKMQVSLFLCSLSNSFEAIAWGFGVICADNCGFEDICKLATLLLPITIAGRKSADQG